MASNVAKGSWTIIVCGDLPSPVPVYIPNPTQYTIAHLKEEIEKKTNVPAKVQILYYSDESPLPANGNTPLISCQGLKNGVAISLTTTAKFVINVQRVDTGGIIKVALPLMEWQDWSIKALRELIFYKFGVSVDRPHVLAIEGEILEDKKSDENNESDTEHTDDSLYIGNYKQIESECLITLTFLSRVTFTKPHIDIVEHGSYLESQVGSRSISLPSGSSMTFADSKICYNRLQLKSWRTKPCSKCSSKVTHLSDYDCPYGSSSVSEFGFTSKFVGKVWKEGWKVHIKLLDGTKILVSLVGIDQTDVTKFEMFVSCHKVANIPIVTLRELVSKKTSIPTYQQRLLFGETVLNDFDEFGQSMLLGDYNIHDGATLCLISITKGIYVKLPAYRNDSTKFKPTYLNIPCPDQLTVQELEGLVRNIADKDVTLFQGGITGGSAPKYIDQCHLCNPNKKSGIQSGQKCVCSLGPKCDPNQTVSSLLWLCNGFKL